MHWQAFDRLRCHPSEENAQAAKRAFLTLASGMHPDQGGTHQEFLRLKDAYDRALAAWQRPRCNRRSPFPVGQAAVLPLTESAPPGLTRANLPPRPPEATGKTAFTKDVFPKA